MIYAYIKDKSTKTQNGIFLKNKLIFIGQNDHAADTWRAECADADAAVLDSALQVPEELPSHGLVGSWIGVAHNCQRE